jgi:hypothetical protein
MDPSTPGAMNPKATVKGFRPLAKPARAPAAAPGRRVVRFGRHVALALNTKLLAALGLAVLVWVLIVAVLVSL